MEGQRWGERDREAGVEPGAMQTLFNAGSDILTLSILHFYLTFGLKFSFEI